MRTPGLGPNDVVDAVEHSYPLDGRVHDCAASGKALAVTTGRAVLVLDGGKQRTIAKVSAERVALGSEWVAWIEGTNVRAKRWR